MLSIHPEKWGIFQVDEIKAMFAAIIERLDIQSAQMDSIKKELGETREQVEQLSKTFDMSRIRTERSIRSH